MVEVNSAERQNPLANKTWANDVVSLSSVPSASRINLRATKKGAKSFEKALGISLPVKPAQTAHKDGRFALWLGPDEWLIVDHDNPAETMVPRLANKEFSATDISHRNMGYVVSGKGAANTLNCACPRNLSLKAFPVGTASRTIFGKAEVVIYRTGEDEFRLECWRSFAPYVWSLLVKGAKDAHV